MKSPKILLVDDEEEFVQTLVERLEFRNIVAKGVTSGKEALRCLVNEMFDVVIVDLKMPEVDGLQIKKIVEMKYPHTKVILVTGHGGQELDDQFLPEIEEDVLMKPFGISSLLERIEFITRSSEE
jgi:DNA-binding response OmpR family regulator